MVQLGHVIAQAVSHWLPTAAAQVQAWVRSSVISGGQSGSGAGFLQVLCFPLPSIAPAAPHSSSGAGTLASSGLSNSGLGSTSPQRGGDGGNLKTNCRWYS
jgi:hypothetical protein